MMRINKNFLDILVREIKKKPYRKMKAIATNGDFLQKKYLLYVIVKYFRFGDLCAPFVLHEDEYYYKINKDYAEKISTYSTMSE